MKGYYFGRQNKNFFILNPKISIFDPDPAFRGQKIEIVAEPKLFCYKAQQLITPASDVHIQAELVLSIWLGENPVPSGTFRLNPALAPPFGLINATFYFIVFRTCPGENSGIPNPL